MACLRSRPDVSSELGADFTGMIQGGGPKRPKADSRSQERLPRVIVQAFRGSTVSGAVSE